MSERTIDVIVAGHVCLDLIPSFPESRTYQSDEFFSPGKLIEVGSITIATGGPVSNTGIPLAKLGMKVSFMSKLGEDELGRLTLERLSKWADVKGITLSKNGHSSYTAVIAPPGIDRIFFHSPGTNHTFSSKDVNYDFCAKAKIFHLGYPPLMRTLYENEGEELLAIYDQVKQKGTTTSMDMALPDPNSEAGQIDWPTLLKRVLPYVDLFHPSAEEGFYMAMPAKFKELQNKAAGGNMLDVITGEDLALLADQLIDWGAGVVTIKTGHRGFYMRSADQKRIETFGSAKPNSTEAWTSRELFCPSYKIDKIASATGAGDCSLAGFITAFCKGLSAEECVNTANILGFQNLHEMDSTSGIKDWETTQSMLADTSLKQNDLDLGEGWSLQKNSRIAIGPNDGQN